MAQIVVRFFRTNPTNQVAHIADRFFPLLASHRAIAFFDRVANDLLGHVVGFLVDLICPAAFHGRGASVGPETSPLADYYPTQVWRTSTPEEQGFDSAKLAEGLLAIREKTISIHSLKLIRNGSVFLDAYFYPCDGSSYHDLASETKT